METNMYEDEDDTETKHLKEEERIRVQLKGFLKEVQIGTEVLQIVEPKEFFKLYETVKNLQKRLVSTEYQVKLLEGQLRTKNTQIAAITREMNTKIGYE